MKKAVYKVIAICLLLFHIIMLSSCILIYPDMWYDYHFGGKTIFDATKEKGIHVSTLKYQGITYVDLHGGYFIAEFSSDSYKTLGYMKGAVGLFGYNYVFYKHVQDDNLDFIIKCLNKSRDPKTIFVREEVLEFFYDTPMLKIRTTKGGETKYFVLDEEITINDLKDKHTTKTLSDKSCCSVDIYIDEQHEVLKYVFIYNVIWYEDGVFYVSIFDPYTCTFDFYTVKSEYYKLFSSIIFSE